MKKQNKYRYLYVLQGWYGDSWSDLVEYRTQKKTFFTEKPSYW